MADDTRRPDRPEEGDVSALLAEMRARLDEAAADIERLTGELEDRAQALDDLEGLTDILLGAGESAVLVVRPDRRVRALSKGAADLLGVDDTHVGRALSSVVPDEVSSAVRDYLAQAAEAADADADAGSAPLPGRTDELVAGEWTVRVTGLPDGGAVLVLHEK
jgi:hypothetical protein